jgi:periplasmic protein TonB
MDRPIRQSFIISVLIHMAFVGAGLLFLLLQHWLTRPEPVVFELVAAAAPAPRQPAPEAVEEAPLEPLRVDQPEPVRPLPDVPELPQPEPQPEVRPEPEPPPRTVSYDEWARSRQLPERVQRVQPQRRPATPVPEIETDVRQRLERQLSPIRLQGVDFSQIDTSDALQRYLAELRARIQEAFEPSGSNLEAEAYFTITAQGRITGTRIHRSSGNPGFDQSVLRTLQSARTPGPPPGNRDYAFSLVFRSE